MRAGRHPRNRGCNPEGIVITSEPIFQIGWPVLRPGGGHGPRKQCRSNATGSKSMGSSRSSSSRSQGGGLGRTAPPQPSLFRRTEPLALLWWPNRSSTPTWMITTGVPSMTRFLGSFKGAWPRRQSTALASRPPERRTARQIRQARSGHERGPRIPKFASDSPLEGTGFEPVWGFSCQVVVFGLVPVLCSERESRSSSRRLRSGSRSAREGSRDRNGSKAWRLAA